jgi:hypothetical protein
MIPTKKSVGNLARESSSAAPAISSSDFLKTRQQQSISNWRTGDLSGSLEKALMTVS